MIGTAVTNRETDRNSTQEIGNRNTGISTKGGLTYSRSQQEVSTAGGLNYRWSQLQEFSTTRGLN